MAALARLRLRRAQARGLTRPPPALLRHRARRVFVWTLRLAFAAALAVAAVGGWRWAEAERLDRAIAAGGPALARLDVPRADFARGVALARAGSLLEAAAAYRRAAQGADRAIAVAAWYNSGNLYLRETRRLEGEPDRDAERIRAVAELAKDGYRRALRLQPDYWPARYNLERTLGWYPDPEDIDNRPLANQGRERAVTTMRGTSLGFP